MATLTIRDLDEQVKSALRVRAARNGRSMEAEVRDILAREVGLADNLVSLGARIHSRFRGLHDLELELPSRDHPIRAVDFDA